MHDKVYDFLFELGFTDQDVDEFLRVEPDGIDARGKPFYGNDIIYAKTFEEEKSIEMGETEEMIEDFWEKGWIAGYCDFHRSNYESFEGRYYKAFPTRYRIPEFKFTKSLRRVLNKNRDLKSVIRPLRITPEKSNLFDTYNFLRHGQPPHKSLLETFKYFSNDVSKKMELCVFKGDRLVACSFFEEGTFALYGNMAFYDIGEVARSLGTLTILLEVQYALSKQMYYYYLGHFYPQNPAYHYKARFGGLELFDWDNECWISFKDPPTKELLKQKLPRRRS
jgi:arginyl-tRNA--protein-N-Asp/Glu arginylyltransferase